jgi:hypothetical protein
MIPPMRCLPLAALPFLACLASTGCATRTETFDVSVRNESATPVVVWLTKIGGPEEERWRSPESIAINYVVQDERLGGVVVPPGNTADTGPQKAKLDRDSRAVLRVYKGEMTMSEMLANGTDSPNRADTILDPGVNRFTVTDAAGKITVTRAGEAPRRPATR